MKDAIQGRPPDLKTRTKAFALRIIRLYAALPKTAEAQVLGKQLLRSGTSVGAHYREAVRSRSTAEFISKAEGALMELEESSYWLELLADAKIVSRIRKPKSWVCWSNRIRPTGAREKLPVCVAMRRWRSWALTFASRSGTVTPQARSTCSKWPRNTASPLRRSNSMASNRGCSRWAAGR